MRLSWFFLLGSQTSAAKLLHITPLALYKVPGYFYCSVHPQSCSSALSKEALSRPHTHLQGSQVVCVTQGKELQSLFGKWLHNHRFGLMRAPEGPVILKEIYLI